ncbi:hypothetical protein C1885_18340 [Pseudomonas sp. GW531-R1]|nr:hypothetical protein C1885_18340 [Pseudomonas sp. GW531-R1]
MSVKNEIIDLINSYQNESDFLEKLLHEQYCYYYYPHEWASGPLWLNHIIHKFDSDLSEKQNQ